MLKDRELCFTELPSCTVNLLILISKPNQTGYGNKLMYTSNSLTEDLKVGLSGTAPMPPLIFCEPVNECQVIGLLVSLIFYSEESHVKSSSES